MTNNNVEITQKEYLMLRKEFRARTVLFIIFGVTAFVLGVLITFQQNRYYRFLYQAMMIYAVMGSMLIQPLRSKLRVCEAQYPNWRKLPLQNADVSKDLQLKRYLIFGIAMVLLVLIFANSFDFSKGVSQSTQLPNLNTTTTTTQTTTGIDPSDYSFDFDEE